jgi:cold shock CspA family protein
MRGSVVSNTIEEGVVTFARFSADYTNGFGFIEAVDGTSIFMGSSSLYQNKGIIDAPEVGDLVTFERFSNNRTGRGPAARRTWLKQKAGAV